MKKYYKFGKIFMQVKFIMVNKYLKKSFQKHKINNQQKQLY